MKDLEKLCESIHLPLQSGSDRMLEAMNRGYTFSQYMENVGKLRAAVPGIAITTDIIAGFPGETPEDHDMTVRALREIECDGIFAFKYSPRPGTRAARMEGQLPDEVGSARLAAILGLQDGITGRKNKTLEGTAQEILVEGRSEKGGNGVAPQLTGRTRTNKIVNFEGENGLRGKMLKVRILRAGMHSLEGEIVR
jgi:tRNA-2-methylthio-N6-dimethylallyladenosine synthase